MEIGNFQDVGERGFGGARRVGSADTLNETPRQTWAISTEVHWTQSITAGNKSLTDQLSKALVVAGKLRNAIEEGSSGEIENTSLLAMFLLL